MSEHRATIHWEQAGGPFLKRQYTRAHRWSFDGGLTVPASSSPANVPVPFSDPAGVDPEEAYVAAISSCHMLTFLFVAAQAGFEIVSYDDDAVGHMTPNERGVPWVSTVDLAPRIVWGGTVPNDAELAQLHHLAHEQCYVANSVKTEIRVR